MAKLSVFIIWGLLFLIPPYADDCPGCDCECVCDRASLVATRDNYAGVRVYKNEHSAYAYGHPNEPTQRYRKDNLGFGTTMGNNLTDWLRVEYETLYMGAQYSMNDTNFAYDIWANFLNAYVLYDIAGAMAPYLGMGVGLTGIWGEIGGDLDNAFDLSYQLMVGVLFKLNKWIDLDLGVKYVNFGKVDHHDAVTRVDATQVYIGAMYKFGL